MRIIETIRNTKPDGITLRARVRYNAEYEEYVVDFATAAAGSTVFHKHKDADYHTDDKQDAINTAKWWTGAEQ